MIIGVAKTYQNYLPNGSPYVKNGKMYISVLHPLTHLPKEVRFYPQTSKPKPLYQVFGFNNENDKIQIILQRNLTQDEEENYYFFNWNRGGKWRFCRLFGGCWYAPKEADSLSAAPFFLCSWQQFEQEIRNNSR